MSPHVGLNSINYEAVASLFWSHIVTLISPKKRFQSLVCCWFLFYINAKLTSVDCLSCPIEADSFSPGVQSVVIHFRVTVYRTQQSIDVRERLEMSFCCSCFPPCCCMLLLCQSLNLSICFSLSLVLSHVFPLTITPRLFAANKSSRPGKWHLNVNAASHVPKSPQCTVSHPAISSVACVMVSLCWYAGACSHSCWC